MLTLLLNLLDVFSWSSKPASRIVSRSRKAVNGLFNYETFKNTANSLSV